MTETSTARGTVAGRAFPDAIGFGFAELTLLLSLRRGPEAEASARALRLTNELDDPSLLAAGASSLVARGAATAEPHGELSVAGPVAAVTSALTEAVKHVQINLLTADSVDNVLSVESPEYKILLQPRAYLSWFAMAQRPDQTPAEAGFYMVRKHLEDNPSGGATIRLLQDDSKKQLLVKRSGQGWTVGYGAIDAPSEPIQEMTGLTDGQVLDHIRSIRQD
ncbi:hypothetical protein NMQ03_15320 [Arthrobacter sp. DNA4]|uniref:hypothetical protein n=1 Tax=Micrococcaceae TaxID=1268 RepID=UPI0020CF28D9|nr:MULTISPECIES: hypothetical protein [Micrococcaceae]UTT68593.1 hypothetical protein NMQ03_15320 [Arthrobacter sp. DNA4]WRT12835.1 hypothetical protein VIK36_15935 [Pseudarthrobacter sp. LT1]